MSHLGESVSTLTADPNDGVFGCSFEEVEQEFAKLPRMFLEPDGSFVWKAGEAEPFQLDGSLVDNGGRVLHVELKGNCDDLALDGLLTALDWPHQQVVFQLVRFGWLLDETEFRRIFCDRDYNEHVRGI